MRSNKTAATCMHVSRQENGYREEMTRVLAVVAACRRPPDEAEDNGMGGKKKGGREGEEEEDGRGEEDDDDELPDGFLDVSLGLLDFSETRRHPYFFFYFPFSGFMKIPQGSQRTAHDLAVVVAVFFLLAGSGPCMRPHK